MVRVYIFLFASLFLFDGSGPTFVKCTSVNSDPTIKADIELNDFSTFTSATINVNEEDIHFHWNSAQSIDWDENIPLLELSVQDTNHFNYPNGKILHLKSIQKSFDFKVKERGHKEGTFKALLDVTDPLSKGSKQLTKIECNCSFYWKI